MLERRPRMRGTAPVASALLTVAVVVSGLAIRGVAPFGPRGRGINDLGNQFVPFHAHLWDLLHGQTPSGWQWSWEAALGVPFVPDLATYLLNPLALTVALWPRDQMESAVLGVTLLTYAAAAAAMVAYLRRVRPEGSPVVAALLGAAYATCGWALDDGSYVPMWLTGLVGLPLIALVGEWARDRAHPVLAPFVVALVWIANFYTAYMATIGAGLIVLARALGTERSWRETLRTLLVATRHLALGVAMSLVTLLPTWLAVRRAQPTPAGQPTAAPWRSVLARLLPLTEGVGLTPGLFVGTATLLLALTLVLNTGVRVRERLAWVLVVAGTLVSLQLAPTQLAWHVFQAPNGSGYREAFVPCAMLVIAAWVSATAAPRALAIAGGAVGTGLVVAVAAGAPGATRWSVPLAAATAALTTLWLVLRRRWVAPSRLAATALVAVLALESVATWVVVDELRGPRVGNSLPAWGPADSRLLQEVHGSDGSGSDSAGLTEIVGPVPANAPMLYGYRGVRYYSSTIPETTSRALTTLGVPWSGGGRQLRYQPDPGLDPLLGVHRVLRADGAEATESDRFTPDGTSGVAGRVLPAGSPTWRDTPWSARNVLAGAPVYTVPRVTVLLDGKRRPLREDGMRQRVSPGTRVGLDVSCGPGRIAQFWAPEQTGRLATPGGTLDLLDPGAGDAGERRSQGVVTIPGSLEPGAEVVLETGVRVALPGAAFGCLDPSRLGAALSAPAGHVERGPASVRVTWPTPQTGRAVLPSTLVSGWRCTGTDGGTRPLGAVAGMLAADVHSDRSLDCRYRTPGLRPGAALSALAALMALAAAGWEVRRARRNPARPSAPTDGPPTARA